MEIFGSTFDDSVFLESKDKRVSVALSSYDAKFCESEWFCESAALDTEDSLEKQKVWKFRGDLAFRQRDFQKALDAYSSCLECIPDNNLTIRRDVLEGMARCCASLGQRRRALGLVDSLSKEVSNTCHLTCLFLLKVSIHQHLGSIGAKMVALQQLCSLLPYNPWHWYSLAQTCLHFLEPDQPQASESCVLQQGNMTAGQNDRQKEEQQEEEREEKEEEEEETEGKDKVWLKASMCFIRTRLLLRILRQQQSSFVLQRNESTLQRTDEALQRLNPKENTLQILTEVMSEDLVPEKMREDSQDGESLATLCLKDFSERWWSKLLLTGVLQTDGPERQRETEAGVLQTDGPEPQRETEAGVLQTDGPERRRETGAEVLQTDGPERQREMEAKP